MVVDVVGDGDGDVAVVVVVIVIVVVAVGVIVIVIVVGISCAISAPGAFPAAPRWIFRAGARAAAGPSLASRDCMFVEFLRQLQELIARFSTIPPGTDPATARRWRLALALLHGATDMLETEAIPLSRRGAPAHGQ